MDFAIRKDARDWFRDIRDELSLEFDSFYFCFIAGITTTKKTTVPPADTDLLVESFPGNYKSRGKLLVALFLSRELDYLGVKMSEKRAVHAEIARLVDPYSSNHLSDQGVREFNKYAHGGYEVLLEWFDERPRSLETFLRGFRRNLEMHSKSESD